MGAKYKELIVSLIKGSGRISGATLKERVLANLQITDDDYPKSTYHRHLNQLEEDSKIFFEVVDGKRIYFIEQEVHPIEGALILEELGGKINAPEGLLPYGIQLDDVHKEYRNPEKFHLIFEFNSTHLCLSIQKKAVPFSLHISRAKGENIVQKVQKLSLLPTIVLELPVKTISGFKSEEQSGHVIIQFKRNNIVIVKDLLATNPVEWLSIKDLSLSKYAKGVFLSSTATVRNEVEERYKNIESRIKFTASEAKELSLPNVIQLSADSFVSIF